MAEAAAAAGHDVTLLLGSVLAPASLGERVEVARLQSTADLEVLLAERFAGCDLLIMAAAVADYRVRQYTPGKTKRQDRLKIELEGTPDLVAAVAASKQPDQRVVAFALEEPHEMESRALDKMKRKGVDAIVANPLSTLDGEKVAAVLLAADGQRDQPGPMTKADFARWLIDKLTVQ